MTQAGDLAFVARRGLPIALASIALVTVGSLAWPLTGWRPDDVPAFAPVDALVRWDAGWYGEIAQNGYWLRPGQQSPVAFFPLYPLAIRAVTALGLNRWVAATLLSFSFALAALLLFRRWAKDRAPPVAEQAWWLLALYPFATYLYGVVYSDALFLLLVVGAFLSLEKDRPLLAALLGALATACRPVAPAVVVGLLARSLERRRRAGQPLRWLDFVPGLAGVGLAAYMAYLGLTFGDPLAFAHVQGAPGWDQPPGWDSWLKLAALRAIFSGQVEAAVVFRLASHAAMTALAFALVVPTFRRLGVGYGLYALTVVAIPAISSKDFQGLGRYVIAAFPLFLTAALLLAERPRLRWAILGVSAVALGGCALALGAGAYVS